MCTKCGKNDVVGEPQYELQSLDSTFSLSVTNYSHFNGRYLAKISVYDKSDEAVFVLFGDDGRELTGKHASELVSNYFEVHTHDLIFIIIYYSRVVFFFTHLRTQLTTIFTHFRAMEIKKMVLRCLFRMLCSTP